MEGNEKMNADLLCYLQMAMRFVMLLQDGDSRLAKVYFS